MRPRIWVGTLALLIMLFATGSAWAAWKHNFACNECHDPTLSMTALDGTTNLCLKCHTATYPIVPLKAGDPRGANASANTELATADASDAMGTKTALGLPVGNQTSHNWGSKDNMPAAGALPPTTALYSTWYNYTSGAVTCSRCHDPHTQVAVETDVTNMTRMADTNAMCLNCHRNWNQSNHGLATHPVGVDLAAANVADPTAYYATPNNIGNASITLMPDGTVSCTSCHGVHYADSDDSTVDGFGQAVNVGDGKMLKANGESTAGTTDSICQSCHIYEGHGAGSPIGCMVCHGGHEYDSGGNPNYFMLKKQVTLDTTAIKAGGSVNDTISFDYTTYPPKADYKDDANNPLCLSCHDLPVGHNITDTCSSCHNHGAAGSGSFGGGCTACHGYAPSTLTAGGPDGYALNGGNDYSTSGVYKAETTTPHAAHANGGGNYTFSCDECHPANSSTATHPGHDSGSFQEVDFGGGAGIAATGGMAANYNTGGLGTCSAVYCHSNGGERTGDGPTRSFVAANPAGWDGGAGAIGTCTACHGNNAATMAANNSATHQLHLGAGPQGKTFGCNVCHFDTATNNTTLTGSAIGGTHVDGSANIAYDSAASLGVGTVGAGSYGVTTGTCGIYCHSDGTGTQASPDWDAAASGACNICHNADAAMATGSHATHVNDTDNEVGRNIGCTECHSNTVSDNSTLSTVANHIDGAKTLGIAADGDQGTCSNISCHSNGNLDGTLAYNNPAWATGNLGCADCHGNGTLAYPTYANGGKAGVDANSHAAHIAAGATCNDCHSLTSTAGVAIDGTDGTQHVDQTVDVAGAQIGGWTDATKTCSTVACHGGANVVWGDTGLSCADCHMSAAADTDDFAWNGTTASIDSDEWAYSGHGLAAASSYEVTGRSGADLDAAASGATASACFYCHDSGVNHNQANYFRLLDNAGQGFTDLNGNCLACHGTTGTGVDPDGAGVDYADTTSTVKVDKFHGGPGHGPGNDGGAWCWDCHDPHGDASAPGQRIQMVQRNASPDTDANGVPTGGLTATDIVFTDNTLGAAAGGFARAAATFAEGICNNCHTATAQYTNIAGAGTHSTDKCTTCHEHSKDTTYDGGAFQGSGCNGCHGSSVSGQYWPDGANGLPAYADNQAGAHDQHVLAISQELYGLDLTNLLAAGDTDAKQIEICAFCHADPGGSGHNNDGGADQRADVYQDSDDSAGNTDVFQKWGPGVQDYAADIDTLVGNQAYNFGTASCSNLACHNDTATPSGGNDWNNPPVTPDCSVCHTGAGSSAGRHDTHVTTEGYACTECHTNNGTYPTATTGLDHADGTVNMAFNNAGSFENTYGGGSITYGGTLIYGDNNFGTCATSACHYDVLSPAFNAAPVGAPNCAVCHGTPSSAKHTEHIGNDAYVTADCADCHGLSANTGDHAAHVSGAIDNTVTYASGDQTCTITCHTVTANDWTAGGTLVCIDCHNATDIGPEPTSGLHAATTALTHDDTLDAAKCNACHDATPSSSHITGVLQDSLQTTYAFNGTNIASYTNAAGCAANCHSDATFNGGVGKWSRKWIGVTDAKPTAASNPGDAVCDNCHNDAIDQADGTTVDNTWNSGLLPGHGDVDGNNGIEMLNQHSQCKTCHGWDGAGANYNETWGTGDHGDGNISMNGPDAVPGPAAGAEYDETTRGCLMACHQGAANANHQLVASDWPIAYGDFGSGDCDSCHASEGATHGSTNESAAMHSAHATSNYIGACTDCHTHDGVSVAPGTGDHFNGTVNFTDAGKLGATASTDLNYLEDTANFATNCTNSCHDVDNLSEWAAQSLAAGDANACVDCHGATGKDLDQGGYEPTSNEHTAHLYNDAIFAPATDCNVCHGANAVNGGHAGHKLNNGIQVTGSISSYTGGDCTNSCHTSATNDWTSGTGSLSCDDCHNNGGNTIGAPIHAGLTTSNGPATGKHGEHVSADADYVGASPCVTCHTHEGALANYSVTGHVDGTNVTFDGSISWTSPTCTNACHDTAAGRDWSVGTLNCNDCHTTALTLGAGGDGSMGALVAPNTGRHTVHMNNASYVGGGCTECHSHSGSLGAAGHVNGPTKTDIEVVNKTTAYNANDTCTNSCHAVVDTRDWVEGAVVDGTALACADCHNAAGKTLNQSAWPPVSNNHNEHIVSNALGGSGNAAQNDCYACHDGTITPLGALKAAGTHVDGTAGNGGFNGSFQYEATAITTIGTAGTIQCSNAACHNGDQTPVWSAASISCGDCHGTGGPLPTGATTAGNHALHANNDLVVTDCAKCHVNAGSYTVAGGHVDHQNLKIELVPSGGTYSDATAGVANAGAGAGINYGGDLADNGTCATVDCHYNNGTPAWNATPTAFPARCVICHNDGTAGTALTNAVPQLTAGIHDRHVTDAANAFVANDCAACHGTDAETGTHGGHAGGSTTYGNDLAGYAAGACNTNLCHDDATVTWADGQTFGVNCGECHGAGGKADGGGTTSLSTSVGPTSGFHGEHMAQDGAKGDYVAGGCIECHGHEGGFAAAAHADAAANITNTVTYNTGTGTCANTCHDVADGNDWLTTPAAGLQLNCSDCHNADVQGGQANGYFSLDQDAYPPTSGKHTGHIDNDNYVLNDCADCHGGSADSGAHASHLNGTVQNTVTYNGTDNTCTNSCHTVVDDRDWTVGTLNCTDCHTTALTLGAGGDGSMSGTVAPNTGRHTVHKNSTNYVAAGCTDCHAHSGVLSAGSNGHVNGPTKTDIGVAGKITVSPIPVNDTCTNNCHDVVDGRDWTDSSGDTAPADGTGLACADCHGANVVKDLGQGAWPPASNAHADHFATNALPNASAADCYACHNSTTDNTGAVGGANHLNTTVGEVVFNGGFNYEATAITKIGSAGTTQCSNAACHNGVQTPTWNKSVAIACGDCHGSGGSEPAPSGTTAGSHAKHIDGLATDYADCAGCHANAASYTVSGGHVDHQNLTIQLTPHAGTYTDADGAAGMNYAAADFADDGTCATVDCHFNNLTPAWGAAGSTSCTSCHNNGTDDTVLTNAAPDTGWHTRHVADADADYVNDCASCHGANDGTHSNHGIINGPDFIAAISNWDDANNTCTNTCHVAGNGDWDETVDEATQTGGLICNDCHNGGGILAAGAANLDASTAPATGKHTKHDANALVGDCTTCHPHLGTLGNPAGTSHVNGPTKDDIDFDGSNITSPAGSAVAWDTTCTNACHIVTNAGDDGWVNDARTLECADCHTTGTLVNSASLGDGTPTSNAHGTHVQAMDSNYGDAVSDNSTAGAYDFSCANCHGTTAGNHMNGAVTLVGNGFEGVGDTCNATTCHSDGQAAPNYATTPAWTTTFAAEGGDRCAKCHGNSPSSGAHSVHVVGIHTSDSYNGTSGLMSDGAAGGDSAHGGTTTGGTPLATTLNCNVCHNATVDSWDNDQNPSCGVAACHGTAFPRSDAAIKDKAKHLDRDGTKDVVFIPSPIRTRAQVRNDITAVAEVDANWERLNDDSILAGLFYKATKNHDKSKQNLDVQAQANWDSVSTCLVSCHNGNEVSWAPATGNCYVCHTQLPQ